jgi:hypothetical protein
MTDLALTPAVRDALTRIEVSWRRLNAELDRIPRDRMVEPGAVGIWSVKDLLGHIAFWDEQAVVDGPLRLRGEADLSLDFDAINRREAARRADRSLDEQGAEMRQAHEALIAFLRGQSTTEREALGLCGCLQGYTHEHYDEHAADLRAWRARVGL